jgi:Phage-related lysozyme (muraminidase)
MDIIQEFEGCKLTAYLCPAGVWTIGWGSTGLGVSKGVVWTQAEADERYKKDMALFKEGVQKLVTVPVNKNQLEALTSFAYNLGISALKGSTLLKFLNDGNYQAAANQFLRWDKANGKVLAGLARRRTAERNLFLKAI